MTTAATTSVTTISTTIVSLNLNLKKFYFFELVNFSLELISFTNK